jgi:hypothetical protein
MHRAVAVDLDRTIAPELMCNRIEILARTDPPDHLAY